MPRHDFYKPIQRPWEEAHGTPNSLNPKGLQTKDLGGFTDLVFDHPYTQSMAGENNIANQVLKFLNGGSIDLVDDTGTVGVGLGMLSVNPNDFPLSGQVNLMDPNRPSATVSHSGTGLSLTGTGGSDPSAYIGIKQEADPLLSSDAIHNQTNSAINDALIERGVSPEVTNAIQSEAVSRELAEFMAKGSPPLIIRRNPGNTDRPTFTDNVPPSFLNSGIYR